MQLLVCSGVDEDEVAVLGDGVGGVGGQGGDGHQEVRVTEEVEQALPEEEEAGGFTSLASQATFTHSRVFRKTNISPLHFQSSLIIALIHNDRVNLKTVSQSLRWR